MSHREQPESKSTTEAAQERPTRAPKPSGEERLSPEPELRLEELDLTIERVEERISPSETNVFDK